MYFKSRVEAGRKLAKELMPKYRYENCAVVALSDGGVVVGAQIAARLHCVLSMLMTEPIHLPGEPTPVAAIDQDGGFTFNAFYSDGQIEAFNSEFHSYIQEERITKLSQLNRLLGGGGIIDRDLLRGHHIILVSDGLFSSHALDAAALYLKSVRIEKLIIAVPLASVNTVDRMHLFADEVYCLSMVDSVFDINHYYDDNTIPDRETIVRTIQDIILKWK